VQSSAGLITTPPWSFSIWFALRYNNVDNWSIISDAATNVGENVVFKAGGIPDSTLGYVQQNIRIAATSSVIYDGNWHNIVWTRDNANNVKLYLDGAQVFNAASITVNNAGATGILQVGGGGGALSAAFYYCAAWWNSQLSAASVTALYGGHGTLQSAPNLNTITQVDLSTITSDLAAIQALLSTTYHNSP
jgi:Concanavalin A-like lectin/glucanases superfamily